MMRRMPPAAPADGAAQDRDPSGNRCPRCGSGDLFVLQVTRRGGGVSRAVYCAGSYDRDRRRFLRRSCGYAGDGAVDWIESTGETAGTELRATAAACEPA